MMDFFVIGFVVGMIGGGGACLWILNDMIGLKVKTRHSRYFARRERERKNV